MMRPPGAISSRDAHIWSLRMIIFAMTILLLSGGYTLLYADKEIVVHLPPDLRSPMSLRSDEMLPASVYVFALSTFQALNFWRRDGTEDYLSQIERYSCYLTPRFKRWLLADIARKQGAGELRRARGVYSLNDYQPGAVERLDTNSWRVYLDFALREWVHERTVKDTDLRYTLRVVRFDFAGECNPWALALDAHLNAPARLQQGAK